MSRQLVTIAAGALTRLNFILATVPTGPNARHIVGTAHATSSGATAIMDVESLVRSTPDPSPSKYCIYSSRSHLIVVASTGLAAAGTTEDHFNAADTDNDGQLTFEEWAASDQNKNMDKDALVARWAKFDSGNVGYLTRTEAASRIA
ncbi:hypothetical protein BD779DRAFT_1472121 [Infundibulicybe gibba]|nr:hypothetical protein BD779DRAFT_1472121 [Infundibulicybe gibba]